MPVYFTLTSTIYEKQLDSMVLPLLLLAGFDVKPGRMWGLDWGKGCLPSLALQRRYRCELNVYMSGYFDGTVDFNSGVGVTNLTVTGVQSAFIVKLGNFIQARPVGNTITRTHACVKVDAAGNSYLDGQFTGTTEFNPNAGVNSLTSAGQGYTLKLNTNGNRVVPSVWVTLPQEYSRDIDLDAAGNVYVGSFIGVGARTF